MSAFQIESVLKRDVFSETQKGFLPDDPSVPMIRRIVTASPLWSRPLAWLLAWREIKALRAVAGTAGTPLLLRTDADGLLRTWSEGTPLHLARPQDRLWYRDAHRLLREFRRRRVTHNDLAKPQNWLMTPEGRAAVIDFQLASVHRRRGPKFRFMAYEDFRHLIKQKNAFAPHLMTPTARRVLGHRSLPSRFWRYSGKQVYNLVTRGVFRWSDGEGTNDRIPREGEAIAAALSRQPGVRGVALSPFPKPIRGSGIYAFVEADAPLTARQTDCGADLVQTVARLPRRGDGALRDDLLALVAMNQITALDAALASEPDMAPLMRQIAEGRLNFSDRRMAKAEAKA
jgi:hypothetical protein